MKAVAISQYTVDLLLYITKVKGVVHKIKQ
jgi:hypothetical protein